MQLEWAELIKELVPSLIRFDPHPPLFYGQLHGWIAFGTSDLWIKLNSIVWALLAALSLYYASRRIFDKRIAVLATVLFASDQRTLSSV